MGVFDFKKRFGKQIKEDEVKRNFVYKINHYLFRKMDEWIGQTYYRDYSKIFDFLCLQLNSEPDAVLSGYNRDPDNGTIYIPPLKYFTNDDFEKTLVVTEILYEYFDKHDEYDKDIWLDKINEVINSALTQPLNLGIGWRGGKFFPRGAEEIEKAVISDILIWLDNYQKAQTLYNNALDHYSQSLQNRVKRKDVISNSFQAVEELTRLLLNNKKSFDNNFNEMVEKIGLNNNWKQILFRYKELSKEFGRHPGHDEEFIPEQEDTEAFLYLSGLIMRLVLEKMDVKRK